jgi:hypothetical protein
MASVDSLDEYTEAQAMGWRTFRVRRQDDAVTDDEKPCPASEEAGHRTTCRDCGLCCGRERDAKSVVIIAHGSGAQFLSPIP